MIHNGTSAPAPTPPPPPWAAVHPDGDVVVLDLTDAALTRLVRLLAQHPWLVRTLTLAAATALPDPGIRHRAITVLRDDPDVQAACAARLTRADATGLATALIGAAASVGTGPDRGPDTSPAPGRTDPR